MRSGFLAQSRFSLFRVRGGDFRVQAGEGGLDGLKYGNRDTTV